MIKILPKLRSRRKSSEAKYRVVMCHEFAHSTDRYDVDVFFNLNDEVQITSVRPITMEKWKALNRHSNVSTQPSDGSQPLEPPKVAEFLAILCAKTIGDALIGCLNEQYAREYVEYGPSAHGDAIGPKLLDLLDHCSGAHFAALLKQRQ